MEAPSFPVDEHEYYPIHEEDHVPEGPLHFNQMAYLKYGLELQFPDRRVESDHCMYWEPGNTRLYRAADVMVVGAPRSNPPLNVYLAWRDGPLLFVVEVASPRTRAADLSDKLEIYEEHLRAEEYLFIDIEHLIARLWRRINGRLREVPADSEGRWWSAQLSLWFQFDPEGFLRCRTDTGELILTPGEQVMETKAQAERAEAEAKRADDAERRIADLMAEVERLRAAGTSAL